MRERHHLSGSRWRTSSYRGSNDECVEAADSLTRFVPIRDSKAVPALSRLLAHRCSP
ncbi:DUF397 domain-containing protein [Streptomyces atratus]|uniref:DUF397 domain-containing protein n=1 Tax=Streptomyces atratus TaxID=1893 RepID=UPI0033F5F574